MKPFISQVWDSAEFWHVFLVSVPKNVYNSMRFEPTRGMRRTAKGESKDVPAVYFMV